MTQNNLNNAHSETPTASRNRWIRSALLLCGAFILAFSQLLPLRAVAGPDVDPDTSVFGVHVYDYTEQEGVIQLRATDTAWVRGFELVWSDLQINGPEDVVTLPADLVSQIEVARVDGFEPILTVRSTPIWAQKYTQPAQTDNYFCGPIKETEFDDFANFLVEALDEFSEMSVVINYLEIWNEPDVAWEDVAGDRIWGGCWGEKADPDFYGGDYYAGMLQAVYPILKAAYPGLQILIGGLQMECDPGLPAASCNPIEDWKINSTKFFDGILEGGGGPYFDGISFHAYDYYGGLPGTYANSSWNSGYDTTGPVVTAKLRYLQARLQEYGVTGKYFLNTENSLLYDDWIENTGFEETKAGYLVKSYATSISLGLKANLWYELVGHWNRGVGLLPLDVTQDPFPAYFAYQFASQTLNNVEPVGAVARNALITGYEFRTSTGLLWVIWSADGSTQSVDLGVEPLAIYDIDGNLLANQANPVEIGYQPVYVELPAVISRQYVPYTTSKFYFLKNGDFELVASAWNLENQGLPAVLIQQPAISPVTGQVDPFIPDGENSILLGNPDYDCSGTAVPLGYAAAEQTFYVPRGQIQLLFDYIIYTQDALPATGGGAYDRFEVLVASESDPFELVFADGNFVNEGLDCEVWRRVPGNENLRGGTSDGWATGAVDMSQYQGMQVRLSFRNYSRYDGWYNTYTYLDNVRLATMP